MAAAPPKLWFAALAASLGRRLREESFAGPLHGLAINYPKTSGLAAAPRDPRPAHPSRSRALLEGEFAFAGQLMSVGPRGDPWNRASPSIHFAVALHGMDWLGDLMAMGEPGVEAALRLVLDWRRLFGRWNRFVWRGDVISRRVFNLACHARALCAPASELEALLITQTLAAQARHLLALGDAPPGAAERLTAAAMAGVALAGKAGTRLRAVAMPRLAKALDLTVLPDGGHASRSPQAGLELLLDLLALDDGLSQLGQPPAEGVSQAIDRLTAAVRFFALPDGALASFQGGEAGDPARVAAARAHDATAAKDSPLGEAPFSGYQRLTGPSLTVMIDAGPPARDGWSVAACGQPAAIEILAGRERLITNGSWSPSATGPQALRLAAGGSTVALGAGVVGQPLSGGLARALGPRLIGGADRVEVHRRESEAGVWVEVSHGGWLATTGLTHERRLFLDRAHDEVRGEDRFIPASDAAPRPVAVAVHFHLHPQVRALLAQDQRSVLLRGRSPRGWWLRNDASEVTLEPSVVFHDGLPVRTVQIVLRGRLRADRGGRVRWKLAAAVEGA
jgi:uncharacterized heparinase superfamily protein